MLVAERVRKHVACLLLSAWSCAQVNDVVGWIAGRLEWWVLWLAAADEKGMISKEKARAAAAARLLLFADKVTAGCSALHFCWL